MAGVERTPGRASTANAAQRGQRVVEREQRRAGGAQRVAQRGHGALERHVLAGERAGGHVEVGHEALQGVLVLHQRREGLLLAAQHPPQVTRGLLAERGVVDQRRVLVGRLPVLDRVVEALGALALEALRVLLEEDLQVLPGVGLQRGEDVAELHRGRGLLDRDHVVLVEHRRGGRAGLHLDELVALEEDARAHLQGGVLVQRQRGLLDLDGHPRAGLGALQRLDLGDLAHLHAGDPHRAPWPSRRRRSRTGPRPRTGSANGLLLVKPK